MVALLSETRITLNELAKEQDVDLSTAWRWALRGVRGCKLETYVRGGRRFSTREAYLRFCEATSVAAGCEQPKPSTSRRRKAEVAGDVRKLEELGV